MKKFKLVSFGGICLSVLSVIFATSFQNINLNKSYNSSNIVTTSKLDTSYSNLAKVKQNFSKEKIDAVLENNLQNKLTNEQYEKFSSELFKSKAFQDYVSFLDKTNKVSSVQRYSASSDLKKIISDLKISGAALGIASGVSAAAGASIAAFSFGIGGAPFFVAAGILGAVSGILFLVADILESNGINSNSKKELLKAKEKLESVQWLSYLVPEINNSLNVVNNALNL